MNGKLASVFNYAAWVFNEYKKLSNSQSNEGQIKIIESSLCKKTNDTFFTIQFFGKSVFPVVNAKELSENNEILLKFSKQDIKKIMAAAKNDEFKKMMASEQSHNIENNIQAVIFDRKTKARIFSVSSAKNRENKIQKYSAKEIYLDKDLLLSLDKVSVSDVSYEAGKESSKLR